jgi:hypothetical protein
MDNQIENLKTRISELSEKNARIYREIEEIDEDICEFLKKLEPIILNHFNQISISLNEKESEILETTTKFVLDNKTHFNIEKTPDELIISNKKLKSLTIKWLYEKFLELDDRQSPDECSNHLLDNTVVLKLSKDKDYYIKYLFFTVLVNKLVSYSSSNKDKNITPSLKLYPNFIFRSGRSSQQLEYCSYGLVELNNGISQNFLSVHNYILEAIAYKKECESFIQFFNDSIIKQYSPIEVISPNVYLFSEF